MNAPPTDAAGAPEAAAGRRWWQRRPLEIPPTTVCRGCGRTIELAGLKPYRRFYCKVCAQMMRTTPKQFAFELTADHRRNQRNLLWLLLLILAIFPVWAQDKMCARSLLWAEAKEAYLADVWAIGLAGALLFRLLRPLSNDIQYWGGVLLIVSNAERLAMNLIGNRLGAPFMLPPPWFGLANGAVMLVCLPIARRIWPSR